jgi:hypothetical protein
MNELTGRRASWAGIGNAVTKKTIGIIPNYLLIGPGPGATEIQNVAGELFRSCCDKPKRI